MAASYNYYAHRQFYINGLTEVDVPSSLQDNETAVTEAIRRLSPICKYDNVKPIWLYSQNGDTVDPIIPRMFAFRNGDLLYRKANDYFAVQHDNPKWERKDTAVICITDWGFRSKDLEGEYEFFVFAENGFLINNSFNSFFTEISGVLYGVLVNCENWPGMQDRTMEEYKRSQTVSVLAIRKNNNIPYAALPNCEESIFYDKHGAVRSENGASVLPRPPLYAEWTSNSGWAGYTSENYGMFITLGGELDYDSINFADYENYKDTIIEILKSITKNRVCFEVPLFSSVDGKQNYEINVVDGSLSVNWLNERVNVADLGIKIDVPFGFVEETLEEGEFTFILSSLPLGSQFWFSNRAVQFVDEICVTGKKTDDPDKRPEDPDKIEYSLTSRAYPCGLGSPFFDKYQGLAYIPLGKCFGNVEDYHQTIAEDDDKKLIKDLYENPKAYEKIGGSVDGLHNFPLLKPKAEDVFVFVGNRYGMVKLTPYVDYTIEECGPISGSMPIIMLQGRSEHEGEVYDGSNFNVLNMVQRTFPIPDTKNEDNSDYHENPNEQVFIRVFYGYPKNKLSTYWGPTEGAVENRREMHEFSNQVAEFGLSIENTVTAANSSGEQFSTADGKLLATATMPNSEALPWSILPREDMLEFDAGRYNVLQKPYLSRVVFDRTFAINTGKFRDVEVHALVDEKYGIANTLWNKQASDEFLYFDQILNILGVNDKQIFVRKAHDREYVQVQSEENNRPAFYYILNNGNQIHESINVEDWLTWLTNIDDRTDEVYDDEAD